MTSTRQPLLSPPTTPLLKAVSADQVSVTYISFTPPSLPPAYSPDVPQDVPIRPPDHLPDTPSGLTDDERDLRKSRVLAKRSRTPTSQPTPPLPTASPFPSPATSVPPLPTTPPSKMSGSCLAQSPPIPPLIGVTPPLRIRKKKTRRPEATSSDNKYDSSEAEEPVPRTPPAEPRTPSAGPEPTPQDQLRSTKPSEDEQRAKPVVKSAWPVPVPRYALGELPAPPPGSSSHQQPAYIPFRRHDHPRRPSVTQLSSVPQPAPLPLPQATPVSHSTSDTGLLTPPPEQSPPSVTSIRAKRSSRVFLELKVDPSNGGEALRNLQYLQTANPDDLIEVTHESGTSLQPLRALPEIAEVDEPTASPTVPTSQLGSAIDLGQTSKSAVQWSPLPDVPAVSPLVLCVQEPGSAASIKAPTRALPTPPSPATPVSAGNSKQPNGSHLPTPQSLSRIAEVDKDLPPAPFSGSSRVHKRSGSASSCSSVGVESQGRMSSASSFTETMFPTRHARKGSASSGTGSISESVVPMLSHKLMSPFKQGSSLPPVTPPTSSSKAAALLGLDAPEPSTSLSRLLKRRPSDSIDPLFRNTSNPPQSRHKPTGLSGRSRSRAATTAGGSEEQWNVESLEGSEGSRRAAPLRETVDRGRQRLSSLSTAQESGTSADEQVCKTPQRTRSDVAMASDIGSDSGVDPSNRRSASPPPRPTDSLQEEANVKASRRHSRHHPFAIAQPVPSYSNVNISFMGSDEPSASTSRPSSDYSMSSTSTSSVGSKGSMSALEDEVMEVLQVPDTPVPLKKDAPTSLPEDSRGRGPAPSETPPRAVSPHHGRPNNEAGVGANARRRPSRSTPSPSPSVRSEVVPNPAPGLALASSFVIQWDTLPNLTPSAFPPPPEEPEDEGESWFDHEPVTPTPTGLMGKSKTWMRKMRN